MQSSTTPRRVKSSHAIDVRGPNMTRTSVHSRKQNATNATKLDTLLQHVVVGRNLLHTAAFNLHSKVRKPRPQAQLPNQVVNLRKQPSMWKPGRVRI